MITPLLLYKDSAWDLLMNKRINEMITLPSWLMQEVPAEQSLLGFPTLNCVSWQASSPLLLCFLCVLVTLVWLPVISKVLAQGWVKDEQDGLVTYIQTILGNCIHQCIISVNTWLGPTLIVTTSPLLAAIHLYFADGSNSRIFAPFFFWGTWRCT
jgi:hypothetical protein